MNSSTGQTRRRIFTLDGSNDAASRKDVPFVGFVELFPILGWKTHKTPIFGGVYRRFQAKRAKYWKFHVIETTTLWVKKTRHLTLAHNFTKYLPIFKILSLLDSVGNL